MGHGMRRPFEFPVGHATHATRSVGRDVASPSVGKLRLHRAILGRSARRRHSQAAVPGGSDQAAADQTIRMSAAVKPWYHASAVFQGGRIWSRQSGTSCSGLRSGCSGASRLARPTAAAAGLPGGGGASNAALAEACSTYCSKGSGLACVDVPECSADCLDLGTGVPSCTAKLVTALACVAASGTIACDPLGHIDATLSR
jgi:hypothetical protein